MVKRVALKVPAEGDVTFEYKPSFGEAWTVVVPAGGSVLVSDAQARRMLGNPRFVEVE